MLFFVFTFVWLIFELEKMNEKKMEKETENTSAPVCKDNLSVWWLFISTLEHNCYET